MLTERDIASALRLADITRRLKPPKDLFVSTYVNKDACTDIILDMLAEHESAGNYNAVIGNAHAADDLSKYTLTEIYGLMGRLLADGQPSSAIGRYQIIRKTLQGLQGKLNLPASTPFTRELQDRLAVELMIGRGYSAWWRGAMSNEDFAHGLSCEWASLPDPQAGGKSHYDGVGPNHAGTTLEHVYATLDKARAAMAPPGMVPVAAPDPDHSAAALNAAELASITGKTPSNPPSTRPVAIEPGPAPVMPPVTPPKPVAKPVQSTIAAGGIAGAVVGLAAYGSRMAGVELPGDVQGYLLVLVTAAMSIVVHRYPDLATVKKVKP